MSGRVDWNFAFKKREIFWQNMRGEEYLSYLVETQELVKKLTERLFPEAFVMDNKPLQNSLEGFVNEHIDFLEDEYIDEVLDIFYEDANRYGEELL